MTLAGFDPVLPDQREGRLPPALPWVKGKRGNLLGLPKVYGPRFQVNDPSQDFLLARLHNLHRGDVESRSDKIPPSDGVPQTRFARSFNRGKDSRCGLRFVL